MSEDIREHINKVKNWGKSLNENNDIIINEKIACIQKTLKYELDKYNSNNLDDRWVDIRQELHAIDSYLKNGMFKIGRTDYNNFIINFLSDLNVSASDKYTYKRGENVTKDFIGLQKVGITIYRALGDEILFRGVSLKDWKRIKSQGYIDSDMRGAVSEYEGINLAQIPSTAISYLPNNNKGVVLAINPTDLDKYMLTDDYIRIFEAIPIKNVIKVSDIIFKDEMGSVLTSNTSKKIEEIVNSLKKLNVEINC